MAFANLREFHNPDLELPIGDKVYRIKSPSAADGIRLRRFFYDPSVNAGPMEQLREMAKILGATWNEEREVYEGGVWSEMEADGVSADEILRAGNTALLRYGMTEEAAERYWHSDEDADPNRTPPTTGAPKKPAANRAARRGGTKKAATGRTTAARKS